MHDVKEVAGGNRIQRAQDRELWKTLREVYVQEWTKGLKQFTFLCYSWYVVHH